MFSQCFPNSKELLHILSHCSFSNYSTFHPSLTHTHTFWIISVEISFTVALIKADCDILLNSAPIKTWHCLKHYQMMLSSVRALVLRPSIFIKERSLSFLEMELQTCFTFHQYVIPKFQAFILFLGGQILNRLKTSPCSSI